MTNPEEKLRQYIIKKYGDIDYGKTIKDKKSHWDSFKNITYVRSKPKKTRRNI